MLAFQDDFSTLEALQSLQKWPKIIQPKMDGVSAGVVKSLVVSRDGRSYENLSIYDKYHRFEGIHGELYCHGQSFYRTSGICRKMLAPAHEIDFVVFDCFRHPKEPYHVRLREAANICRTHRLTLVESHTAHTPEEALYFYNQFIEAGYEGAILRDPDAPYKQGRSTLKEEGMLKMKAFEPDEAICLKMEPRMHNLSPKTRSPIGRAKRSSSVKTKQPLPTLGRIMVQSTSSNLKFWIGSGWDAEEAEEYWRNRKTLIGKGLRYKYQKYGTDKLPRTPIFQGFKD